MKYIRERPPVFTGHYVNPNAPATSIPAVAPAANARQPVQVVRTNQGYVGGTRVSDKATKDTNELPQNQLADVAALEDELATAYHSNEDPAEQTMLTDGAYKLTYKYFNSDKCVEIFRLEGDVQTHQWLKHPLFHHHDASLPQSGQLSSAIPSDGAKEQPLVEDLLIPAARAQSLGDRPERQQVQATCQNPHPGGFRYWWGPPIDQCQSPMYRQFGDGCTHYQIFNRCANVWDPRIFWTFCKQPPHF